MINLSCYRAVTKILQFNYNFQHKKTPDFSGAKNSYINAKRPIFRAPYIKRNFITSL